MKRLHLPAILDIEASGFGKGSYPIEVGIATETGVSQSWLILPEADWTHWKDEAEQLHGISRDQLMAEGVAVKIVAEELNQRYEGQTLYSDGWGFDSGWLGLLFYVSQKSMLFKLETLPRILTQYQLDHWNDTKKKIRDEKGWGHHRAAIDAQLLQLTFAKTAIDEQLAT